MTNYIIQGGNRLEGIVNVAGSKNASLPIIGACILNKGIVELNGIPDIHDAKIMFKILENLGCEIIIEYDKIIINSEKAKGYEIPEDLMREMRSSIMLAGAILGRFNKVVFSQPGRL